ncbi:MAG: Permease [Bacteroidetes bacterium]|nr:MAG: Permease [Bacteroidota bacterium]
MFRKYNPAEIVYEKTKSLTIIPGLAAIDSKTESDAPSVGYATVYPTALVLMIIFSQLLSLVKF